MSTDKTKRITNIRYQGPYMFNSTGLSYSRSIVVNKTINIQMDKQRTSKQVSTDPKKKTGYNTN